VTGIKTLIKKSVIALP